MRREGWLFILILLIINIAVIINLAQPYKIAVDTKIPFLNQKIAFNYDFPGINLGFFGLKPDYSFRRGLDLEGGTSVTLQADMTGIPSSQREDALNSAKSVIERRVNFFGVSEPVVQTSKANQEYRIIVEIPGVTDVNQAVALVGKTAKLTFWEEGPKQATGSAVASGSAIPLGLTQVFDNPKQTDLTGGDLKQAGVTFNAQTGKPEIALNFTAKGSKKFTEITKRNVGNILAIALDDQMIQAPRVNEAIYGGNAVINGDYTTEEAKAIQIQLNAGALPISLSVLEQHAIGATLGQESLQKSFVAGVLGFAVIVFFMIGLYGRLGFIASLALVVYTLIVLTLFRLIPVTLTLAGIAGFILSIGIAVDANILIFERIKEELRRGRSQAMAIDLGFSRAWLSIRDSNVASLIISVVLYYFGTGVIRGFAFTLALGVIVSMFSAIVVTRTLLKLFYKNK